MSYGDFPPPPQPPQGPPQGFGGQPGQAGPSFTLSSWGRRAGATLVDAAIYIGILIVVAILAGIGGVISETAATLLGGLGYLCYFAFVIYQLVRQGQTGQTIGKRTIGISVVRESDATVIGWPLSIVRQIAHIADSIICGIGYLFPLWDQKRQTLADKIVGTVVVDTQR